MSSGFPDEIQQRYGPDVTITTGNVWGFQWGLILAPEELGVGPHDFAARVTNTQYGVFQDSAHIIIQPPGSAACSR